MIQISTGLTGVLAAWLLGVTALLPALPGRAAQPPRERIRTAPSPFNFFIQNPKVEVRVLRGMTSAEFAFTTKEPSHGRVEISTRRYGDFPDTTPAGQPFAPPFPPGAVTLSWNDGLGPKSTQHSFRMPELTPNIVYYFVITAAGPDGRTFRYAHNFSTTPGAQAPAAPPLTNDEVNALAARGAELTDADPLLVELRSREARRDTRRGFEVGIAAAEGHTLPGPGKDRTRESLRTNERPGFDTAITFSLERNRNADLARLGAAIAKSDAAVAKARTADPAVLYWLGFDIATGIFGDPALGARGNTATGPGSLRIRDALSAAGQRGFNAAVTFHLQRNYRR